MSKIVMSLIEVFLMLNKDPKHWTDIKCNGYCLIDQNLDWILLQDCEFDLWSGSKGEYAKCIDSKSHFWHGTINLDSLLFLSKLNSPKSHKPVRKTASEEPVVTRGHRPCSAFQRAYTSGTLRGCLPPSARVRSTTLVLFKIKITIAMGLKKRMRSLLT